MRIYLSFEQNLPFQSKEDVVKPALIGWQLMTTELPFCETDDGAVDEAINQT